MIFFFPLVFLERDYTQQLLGLSTELHSAPLRASFELRYLQVSKISLLAR